MQGGGDTFLAGGIIFVITQIAENYLGGSFLMGDRKLCDRSKSNLYLCCGVTMN